ncbi:AMP-binding protein, partial [Pseudomonas aeruginosa]|nr:AMP-binding protein [Pseudomonas aeruginosa]
MRPEVAQERRYLQGAPLGMELPGRIALRDPHCAWQWFEPEAAAEAFPAAHWLAAFLVLLGRYGNEEITLGFPEPITVRGRQAPALLRSSYRAMESSAERSARLAEELDDARRQLSADGQERAALAGLCAVQVLAARPTASSPGWLALVLAADGSVGLALRDPQYDELRRIAGHLARLARGLVDAQACVGRLPWLDADEERRLQALRSEPQAAPSRGVLHHLFEAQARRTPQRIAVHAADRSLSYAELERESAALAVRLRAAGVAPEQRVGVCLRRDSGLLVGLLGVLRAGGCYVPLDPAYPEERVAYMLDDADCLLVLVDASTRERVAALGRPCLTLEEGGDQANDLALPASEVGADHLAYIIYTSGSTGRPKGVAIEHGSAHAFLRWAGQHYAAEEWSGVLAATSVCFDLSVYELFGTLAEGGTLHLVENLFSLPDYPRRDEISLLNTVPSVCAALLALGDLPGGVRTLNLAGEPLRGHLVRQIRGQPQVRRLVNLYGPTEDTTYSTAHELDLHAEALDEPPIGRPLPGTTVEVLDGPGAWLFRQAGADRRAFPRRSGQRRAPLSHRRPRTHARGRRAGTPRPARRPGQVQRLPHRAGRDRLVPGEFSRGERSLRHAHRGQRRPASAGRLPGGAVRPAAQGAERAPWAKSAALHVAVSVRGPGGAAQDAQRQDRPQGPAASPGDRRRAAGAAQRSAGAGATPGLAGAAWCAAARRTGLLRRRRRFPAGGAPARDAAPATVPTRTVAGVRRWPVDARFD